MAIIKTPEFNSDLLVRQVQESFELYLTEQSSMLGVFLANGRNLPQGTSQKYEWLESQLTPQTRTVNGAIAQGAITTTPATVTFDSTVGMEAGMILRFETTAGKDVDDTVFYVDVVTNTTTAKLALVAGTDVVGLPDNSTAYYTTAEDENKKSFAGDNDWEPSLEYNNFQIVDVEVELSDTVMNSIMYGGPNQASSQLQQAFYKYDQRLSEAASRGFRSQRGSTLYGTTKSNGTMQGYQKYINVSGGNVVDAGGAALTQTMINDAAQLIVEDGGSFDALMCNYDVARQISAFNTSGNNPLIQRSEVTAGSYVMNFVSDLPVKGGLISKVIVDEKVGNDKLFVVNSNKIALVPFNNRGLKLVETSLPGQDGRSWALRGEYTLACQDAKYSHGVISDLA